MQKWTIAWSLAGIVALGACGGPKASLRSDNARLQKKVNDLRARARKDRNKIRDLENQVFLLTDKLDTADVERGRLAEPALPVEVLEPEPAENPDYQVVGVDADGNQIVYVGEAAQDRSVAPRLEAYSNEGEGRTVTPLPAPSGPPIREPSADDRITVTGTVPTIDRQLRQARRAPNVAGARTLYQRHYASLRAGDHTSAVAGFRAFVEAYPDHDYADNAQYWLGEAYYDQKQYKRAMREFRRVVKHYPRGNKVPDALLKIGYCYAALGEADKARDVLQQVTRVYPSSSPAKLATAKLEQLAGGKE